MKQKFLFSLRAVTMLLVMCLSIGNVWGTAKTVSWSASTGAFGSAISSVDGTATGNISTGTFQWNYTRTLKALTSKKSDYCQMSNGYMQCGSGNAANDLTLTTSNIPGTIKSIVINCASNGSNLTPTHTLSVSVGGTSYTLNPTTVPFPTLNNGNITTTGGSDVTATGSSSGTISVSFVGKGVKKALYIKSISVTYEESTQTTPSLNAAAVKTSTLGANSVTLQSKITATGGVNVTEYGFVYGTSASPTVDNSKAVVESSANISAATDFEKEITGLSAGTKYYARAYAVNTEGTAYSSSDLEFTTEQAVDTRTAVNISTFTTTGGVASIVKSNTLGTSVTNDQSGWTAAYTYESSNTSVATVANDGTITAVAKGTATITAKLNVSDKDASYKAGTTTSKSIDITVTNPTHHYTFSANGTTFNEGDVEEGEAITFPTTTPDDVNDKKFQGWYAGDYSNSSTAPTYVTSATMGENDVTYKAVYATVEDGGSGYKLVSTLTDKKNYIFVTANTAKSAYALSSSVTTGTSTTIVESGSDKVVSGTPANSIIWYVTFGTSTIQLKNVSTSTYLKINGSTFALNETSSALYWTTDYGLNGKSSGSTKYYVQCTNQGTFSKSTTTGSTTNRVWAYEQYDNKTCSDYCTTVAAAAELSSLTITTQPNKTKYKVGEIFDATDMVVTANYVGGGTKTIANSKCTISKTTALTTSDEKITISYTENTITRTADVTIHVLALDHLTITTAPTKTTYDEGEQLAISGMVVKGTWGTGETTIEETLSSGYTCDPANGAALATTHTTFTVSYTHEGTTKTVDQAITVNELPTWTTHFFINSTTATDKAAKKGIACEVPEVNAPVGFEFMGWASATLDETETAPTSYALAMNATTYTATADGGNFYAVFKKIETEDKEGGFKMNVVSSNNTYYVGSRNGKNYYLNKVNDADDAEVFFIEDNKYLYYYADGAKLYVYPTANSNASLGFSNEKPNNEWNIETTDNGTSFQTKIASSGNFYLAYNTSSPRFTTYSAKWNFTKTDAVKTISTYSYSTSATVSALSSIAITTAPSKTEYYAGDGFEGAGMVVKATYDNGKTRTVTDKVIVKNGTNLAVGTTSLTVSYTENEVEKTATQAITVTAIELTSIEITTVPDKTVYLKGENFVATGMVVKAHYNDSRKDKEITDYTITDGDNLAIGKETVTISYTDETYGGTKTTKQSIAVNSALQSIAITTNPTKMTYTEGESFDRIGMVVTAYYADETNNTVENYTVTPDGALNTIGTQTMTVHYTEQGTEKTATIDVTVNAYPTYSVTFKVKGQNDNVLSESTGKAGVKVPDNPAQIGDYTFDGWSTTEVSEETTTVPTYITITDGQYYPTKDESVYAVYTTTKNSETKGMWMSIIDGENTKYIGAADFKKSSGEFKGAFGVSSATSGATTFYLEGKKLFWMDGMTKYYLQTYDTPDMYRVENADNATEWTITKGASTTTFYNGSRYLAYNSTKFSTYSSSPSYPHDLTISTSTEGIVAPTAHYSSNPSSAVTPTITFTNPTTTVVADQSVKNVATSNKDDVSITYSSSDEEVATVAADGTVTGHKNGNATITATIAAVADKYYTNSTSYDIKVDRITTNIAFDGTEMIVYMGNEYSLSVKTNSDATPYFAMNSAGYNYASIDGSTLKMKGASGSTKIDNQFTLYGKVDQTDKYTAATSSGTRAEISVKVKDNRKDQSVAFAQNYEFANGATEGLTFTADYADEKAPKTNVTYSSNNTSVAEVNETTGEVTVHSNVAGSATITATVDAGNVTEDNTIWAYQATTATYTITVDKATADLAFSQSEIDYDVVTYAVLDASSYIQNTHDATMTYSCEPMTNVEQADVMFQFSKEGDYVITANSDATDQYKAGSTTMTVHAVDARAINAPNFKQKSYTVAALQTKELLAEIENNSSTGAITWRLANETYGTIDGSTGVFTAKGGQTGSVTAYADIAADNNYKATTITCTMKTKDERSACDLAFEETTKTLGILKYYEITANSTIDEDITYEITSDDADAEAAEYKDGKFRAEAIGTYVLTARMDETTDHTAGVATCTITVEDKRLDPQLAFEQATYTVYNNDATCTVKAISAAGSTGAITYRDAQNTSEKFYIDTETGEFYGYQAGTYYIKASIEANDEFTANPFDNVQCTVIVSSDKNSMVSLESILNEGETWNIDEQQSGDITVEVSYANGYSGTIQYTITPSDKGATYDGETFHVTQPATYTLTASAPAIDGYVASEASVTIKVVDNNTLSKKITMFIFGHEVGEKVLGYEGDNILTLLADKAPAVTGYTFKGWSTASEGGSLITADATLADDMNVYAIYTCPDETSFHYEKVTAAPSDWSGEYLIVYENGNNSVAWNGAESDLDGTGHTISVSISNNQISSTQDGVSDAYFTFAKQNTGYTIKAKSGEWVGIGSGNGVTKTQTVVSLSIVDNSAVIGNGTRSLRCNPNNNNPIFRFYTDGQQPVQLYKKIVGTKDVQEADMSVTTDDKNSSDLFPLGVAGNVTVGNDGDLNVDADLTVSSLVITSKLGKGAGTGKNAGNCGEVIVGKDASLTITGDAMLELMIDPTGVASYGWYAFSVPFPVDARTGIYGKNIGGDWHQLTMESDYAIMVYQGDVRAQGKYGWIKIQKTGSTILQPGVFYLITVADTDFGTLRFKKTSGSNLISNTGIQTYEYAASGEGTSTDAGWNGIGNPNIAIAQYVDNGGASTLQFYDHTTNSFTGYSKGDINVVVGSAFFIQRSNSEEITMKINETVSRGYRAPARENEEESQKFAVQLLEGDDMVDQVFVSATETATSTYEIGHDVAKAFMSGAVKCAQIYVNAYNTKLCDAEFPLMNDQAEFPIELTAPAMGEYELYVNKAPKDATLYLCKDGHIVWNLSLGAYEIELQKGTTTGYSLRLVQGRQTTTDVQEVYSTEDGTQKFIYRDKLIIIHDGKVYDGTGAVVK